MLRVGLNNVIRRTVVRSTSSSSSSFQPFSATQTLNFHSSRRNEKAAVDTDQKVKEVAKSDGGLLGTGLSSIWAVPIGIIAAVPAIKMEWLVVNEEFQLAGVFVAFCIIFYQQGGEAVYNVLKADGDSILKEQNEVEDKVIAALEEKLAALKGGGDTVSNFEAINAIREQSYANLNAAGKVKPLHDFKAQVEKILNMIAVEETAVFEKSKTSLLTEATATVTAQFSTDKQLKKAALDAAIASIKGTKKSSADPVQAAFLSFFKDKKAAAAKADTAAEEAAERAALVAKLNSVAKNEGFLFEFDDKGMPKMTATA